jgi:hypothetical protein
LDKKQKRKKEMDKGTQLTLPACHSTSGMPKALTTRAAVMNSPISNETLPKDHQITFDNNERKKEFID